MNVRFAPRWWLRFRVAVPGPVVAKRCLSAAVRRVLDIVIALAVLCLMLPILAVVMIAIRRDSPGPVIFRQQRVGQGGRLFTLYKLRGMYVDARERWPALYAYRYQPEELLELRFHQEHDPRVTRVGRFIRHLSIDELPNLWNVLKGDMSLVGPRPEIPEMLPYYGEAAALILSLKPGVTSLPKVTGRDGLTVMETLALDLKYIEERSLWLDLKIMAATLGTVLLRRGILSG